MQSKKAQNKKSKQFVKPGKSGQAHDTKKDTLKKQDLSDSEIADEYLEALDNEGEELEDDDLEEDPVVAKPPLDEDELVVRLTDEMHGNSDVEDDDEFIQEVEKFKKEHSKSKIINIYDKIGRPVIADCSKLDPQQVREELKKIIVLLDEHNIIVHFHHDYPEKEKYRFITAEIFNEAVEKGSKSHISFIYEDYHPEMDEDEDEESF